MTSTKFFIVRFSNGGVKKVLSDLMDDLAGIDVDSNLVVKASWSKKPYFYPLTPCCNATGKGSVAGDYPCVVCRSCYREVDPYFGGDTEVAHTVVSFRLQQKATPRVRAR